MRVMLLAFCAAIVATAAPAAAGPRSDSFGASAKCPDNPAAHHAQRGKSVQPHKLTDLPPAEPWLAVLRRGPDGCIVPVRFNERGPRRDPSPAQPKPR